MDYKEAVKEIEGVAHDAEKTATVDMDLVFKDVIEKKTLNYRQAMKELVAFGPMVAEQQPEEAPAQAQQTAQKAPTAQRAKASASVSVPAELEKEAAAELRKVVSGIGGGISEIRERRMLEKLILPRLSISDQMSELEKIEIGNSDGSFSDEQKKLIRDEVKGLIVFIRKEDTSRLTDEQKELVALRNEKVNELKLQLGIK